MARPRQIDKAKEFAIPISPMVREALSILAFRAGRSSPNEQAREIILKALADEFGEVGTEPFFVACEKAVFTAKNGRSRLTAVIREILPQEEAPQEEE